MPTSLLTKWSGVGDAGHIGTGGAVVPPHAPPIAALESAASLLLIVPNLQAPIGSVIARPQAEVFSLDRVSS